MTTTITTQHQIINPLCSSIFVKRILASTIQQLEHKINLIARPSSFSSSEQSTAPIKTKYPIEESEQDFYKYEYYRRKKYLLLHIQSLLTPDNADLIHCLLVDNYLCEFEGGELDVNSISELV